ncbi:unnamed protein product [Echinostoma caproni]|uniref:Type II toxin-antitoxin system HicA family toxin n=1 Tax=Echinostoma caproni TaxID=27848 RepID=A0A183AF46_9TREM|nr:unnamed protein product [Echinostoma caproni]
MRRFFRIKNKRISAEQRNRTSVCKNKESSNGIHVETIGVHICQSGGVFVTHVPNNLLTVRDFPDSDEHARTLGQYLLAVTALRDQAEDVFL